MSSVAALPSVTEDNEYPEPHPEDKKADTDEDRPIEEAHVFSLSQSSGVCSPTHNVLIQSLGGR